jgi:hypothetical protein
MSRNLSRQLGWVGIVGVLIALAIVAVLAQTLLRSYGLLSGSDSASRAGPRAASAVGAAPADPTVAPPTPAAPLDRARGVERTLQRDARDLERRIDESTK